MVKIVLLDNNLEERTIIRKLVKLFSGKSFDIKIYSSENGIEGLGYVFIAKPDILILNSKLPRFGGVELIEYLNDHADKVQGSTTLQTIILHDKDQIEGLSPEHYLVFNKYRPDFFEKFFNLININLAQVEYRNNPDHEEHTYKINIEKPTGFTKFYIDLVFGLGERTIRWSKRSRKLIEKVKDKFLLVQLFYYLFWVFCQFVTAINFSLFNTFTGKNDPEENLEQSRKDSLEFRVRYYPTLITFITGFLFLFIQLVAFLLGGTFLFSRNTDPAKALTLTTNTTYTTNQTITDGLIIGDGTNPTTLTIDPGVTVNVSGGTGGQGIRVRSNATLVMKAGSTLNYNTTSGQNINVDTGGVVTMEDCSVGNISTLANNINQINIVGTVTVGTNCILKVAANADMNINSGGILNLGAGSTVKMNSGRSIVVGTGAGTVGTIRAIGVSGNPVIFESNTGTAANSWAGININYTNNYAEPDNGGTKFDYVTFRYGGNSVLNVSNGYSIGVYNSTFQTNTNAITLNNTSSAILDTITFNGNTNYPIQMVPQSGLTLNNTFTFTSSKKLIALSGTGASATIPVRSWGNGTQVQYYISGSVSVPNGATINISPGNVFKGNANTGYFDTQTGGTLNINGTNATTCVDGTKTCHVTFTSYKDDATVEDIWNDGATTGTSGDWQNILVSTTNTGIITATYADFKFFGNNGDAVNYRAMDLTNSSSSCTNCTFTSGVTAFSARHSTTTITPTLTDSTFSTMTGYPIVSYVNSIPTLSGTFTFTSAKKTIALNVTVPTGTFTVPDIRWGASGAQVQYYLPGTVNIGASTTVNLAPGTVFKGNGTGQYFYLTNATGNLNVNGTNNTNCVDGTKTCHVTFTSYLDDATVEDIWNDGATSGAAGNWQNIIIGSPGNAVVNYGDFKFFGNSGNYYDYRAVYFSQSTSSCINCTFTNGYTAIQLNNAITPTLTDITFTNVSGFPISTQNAAANPTLGGTFTFTNSKRLYAIGGTTSTGSIPVRTWPGSSTQIQYYVGNNVTIPNSATLTIDPGNIIKGSGQYFEVQSGGTMTVNGNNGSNCGSSGSATCHITFTSYLDDAIGGDIWNDGATSGAAGQWTNQVIYANGILTATYADIKYFGHSSNYLNHRALEISTSTSSLSNVTFTDGYTAIDMRVTNGITPTFTDITFTNVAGYPISMFPNVNPTLAGTFTFTNSLKLIALTGSASTGTLPIRTWPAEGSQIQYYLSSTISVPNGASYTVAPGNIIKGYSSGQYFDVATGGTLTVNGNNGSNCGSSGSATCHIIFTSYLDDATGGNIWTDGATSGAAGHWNQIIYSNGVVNATYADFKFFGSSSNLLNNRALEIGSSSSSLSNVTFTDGYTAIDMRLVNSITPTFTDLTFTNVAGYPISMLPNSNPTLNGTFTFTNSIKLIAITGTAANGSLPVKTWPGGDQVVYFISAQIVVPNTVTYNINAGVVIKGTGYGNQHFYLNSGGTLNVNGTSGSQVVFTSYRDDTYFGDSYNDGSAAPGVADFEQAIVASSGSTLNITQTTFRYGGATDYSGASQYGPYGMIRLYTSNATLSDITFDNCQTGIEFLGNVAPSIGNITFASTSYHMVVDVNAQPNFTGTISKSGTGYKGFWYRNALGSGLTRTIPEMYYADGAPIVIITEFGLTVGTGTTLNIAAGVILKDPGDGGFYYRNGIEVAGTLNINGTSSKWSAYTALSDDTVGGDTNANGTTAITYGEGIRMLSGGVLNMQYTVLRYHISSQAWLDDQGAILSKSGSNTINLTNVVFSNNSRDILVAAGTTPTITFNNVDIKNSAANCSGTRAVQNLNTSIVINASTNTNPVYWGGNAGPLDNSDDTGTGGYYNPTGNGVCISNYINYGGWAAVPYNVPNAPSAINDGLGADIDYTNTSVTSLSANWTSGSGFTGTPSYDIAIGTTPGGVNILGWTSVGNVTTYTRNGLTLTSGTTYYYSVRSNDALLGTSGVTTSDGITVDGNIPSNPTTLIQYRSDGTTVINEGGLNDTSTAVLKATISDSDGAGTLYWDIEMIPQADTFTGTPTKTVTVSYSGGNQVVTDSYSGLSLNTKYKWRTRVRDQADNPSSWVNYGGNNSLFDFKYTQATKILVRLPGQSFTSGVGVSGTPTGQTVDNQSGTAYYYAVDDENYLADWHSGNATLSSSDSGAVFFPSSTFNYNNGVATFAVTFYTANTTTGQTITVHQNSGSAAVTDGTSSSVIVSPAAGHAGNSTISTDFSTRIADNSQIATITVTVKDIGNNPVSGKTIVLSSTGTGNTISQPSGVTDANGQVTGTIRSTKAEAKTISATNSTDGHTITQTVNVTFVAGTVSASASTVSASPTLVVADNNATSTVTVTLKDQFGNPVSGKNVDLSSTGTGNTISQPSSPTDSSGVTTGTIKSSTPESKTISAVNTSDSILINQTAVVQFVTYQVTVSQSGGTTNVVEGGATDTYTLVLTGQPSADVVISINPNSQLSTDKSNVTFTTGNWDTPQVVTVTAIDDLISEGGHNGAITHSASSSDTNYNNISINSITANISDNDVVGITVTESGGSTTAAEGGANDSFTMRLDSQPTATVTISISSDSQSTMSPGSLIFTTSNWSTPQTVNVSAVNDPIVEGNHSSIINFAVSGGDYNNFSVPSINASIADNDIAGVTLIDTGGSTNVVEDGATDSYSLVLNTQPSANVTITLSPNSQLSVNNSSVVFTTSNWNTPQSVTISAANDFIAEGVHSGNISHSASSSDINYNGISIVNLTVSISDNDNAGIIVTESSGNTGVTEGGASDTYSIVLTSQPISDVNIAISNDIQVNTTPLGLTFNSSNWNTPQTVTVTATDDSIAEGNHTGSILHSSNSSDSNYNGLTVSTINVSIADNDNVGVTITQSAGNTDVTEGGSSDSYTLVLTSEPTGNVIIDIQHDSKITANTSAIIFTSANWNTPQTVTIEAVDNDIDVVEDIQSIISHPITSTDTLYDQFTPGTVIVTIHDNDSTEVPPTSTPTPTPTAIPTTTSTTTTSPTPSTINITATVTSSPTPTVAEEPKVNVRVLVVDENNQPIRGAIVTIGKDKKQGRTNDDGVVIFLDVPSGDHEIMVSFEEKSITKTVKAFPGADNIADVTINLDTGVSDSWINKIFEEFGPLGVSAFGLYLILILIELIPLIKFFILEGFILSFISAIFSSEGGRKVAYVVDDISFEKIPFAGIKVIKDSKVIKKLMTHFNGSFYIKLEKGQYTLEISRWDYETKSVNVTVENFVEVFGEFEISKFEERDFATIFQFSTFKLNFVKLFSIIVCLLALLNLIFVRTTGSVILAIAFSLILLGTMFQQQISNSLKTLSRSLRQ